MTTPSTSDGPHGTDLNADSSGSDDSAMRPRGVANAQGASGVEGLGGGSSTPDTAGQGIPDGAQQRTTDPAPPNDPAAGTTSAVDLSAFRNPGNAVADNHQTQPDDAPITHGDPSPYLAANTPAARHHDGSLSVAGGSAIGSADDLELPAILTPTKDDDAPKR